MHSTNIARTVLDEFENNRLFFKEIYQNDFVKTRYQELMNEQKANDEQRD